MEDSQTEEVLTDDLLLAIADNIAATYQIEPADGASAMPRGRGRGRRPRGQEDVDAFHKKVVVTAL
jgi:hypothetical protein